MRPKLTAPHLRLALVLRKQKAKVEISRVFQNLEPRLSPSPVRASEMDSSFDATGLLQQIVLFMLFFSNRSHQRSLCADVWTVAISLLPQAAPVNCITLQQGQKSHGKLRHAACLRACGVFRAFSSCRRYQVVATSCSARKLKQMVQLGSHPG